MTDQAHHDANDVVLQRALDETLGGAKPPDLSAQILERLEHPPSADDVEVPTLPEPEGEHVPLEPSRRRSTIGIGVAAAAAVIGFGLIGLEYWFGENLVEPHPVTEECELPRGMRSSSNADYTIKKDAIELSSGWLFVDGHDETTRRTINVASHRVEHGGARLVLLASAKGAAPPAEEAAQALSEVGFDISTKEKNMLLDKRNWIVKSGLAMCVLAGSVTLDGVDVQAQSSADGINTGLGKEVDDAILRDLEDMRKEAEKQEADKAEPTDNFTPPKQTASGSNPMIVEIDRPSDIESVENPEQVINLKICARWFKDDDLALLARFPNVRQIEFVNGLPGRPYPQVDFALFSGNGFAALEGKLPLLFRLSIEVAGVVTSLTADGVAAIAKLKSIVTLKLTTEKLSGADFAPLANLSRLKSFTLSGDMLLDGEFLAYVAQPNLQSLHLRCSKVNGSHLAHLSRAPDLRELQIESSVWSSSTRIAPITDDDLTALAINCPKLQTLSFFGLMGDGAFTGIGFGEMPSLSRLDVEHSAINDAGAKNMARKLTRLGVLVLRHAPELGNEGLVALGELPKLEMLSIGELKNVTDDGFVAAFQNGFKKLLSLWFSDMPIKASGLKSLNGRDNYLTTLGFNNCELGQGCIDEIMQLSSFKNAPSRPIDSKYSISFTGDSTGFTQDDLSRLKQSLPKVVRVYGDPPKED